MEWTVEEVRQKIQQKYNKDVAKKFEVAQIPCRRNKKPTVQEIKALSEMTQRIYKVKRKAVTDATTSKWPGNNIPVFKKDNEAKKGT
ncbi:uncharacterized protein [Montipora foliosa]|uniref:uncharacterized protein isoform X2 n=1 Tax=Montipora foliosa TaxID=591990 RepID=UPI0035F1C69F